MMRYFSHDLLCRQDDKIWELIDRHGLTGYGAWWVIVEELYKAELDGFQIQATEIWIKRLSKELGISDYRTLPRLLDTFAELKLIDAQMWAEHVVYSHAVVDRGDNYIQKKQQNAKRKQEERERKRKEQEALKESESQPVTGESRVTGEDNSNVTRDSYDYKSESESESESESDLCSSPLPPSKPKPKPKKHTQVEEFSSSANCDRAWNERTEGELPPWRTGRGPNDWNEEVVQGFMRYFTSKYPHKSKHTRGDVIAFIAGNEKPGSPKHSALLAYVPEVLELIQQEQKRLTQPPSSAPPPIPDSEIVTGEAAKAQIAALKQKLSATKERHVVRNTSTEADELEF